MEYDIRPTPMMDELSNFQYQLLHDENNAGVTTDMNGFDIELANTNHNRNRGKYRCSKCGEPKKGHVCPLVPSNFKCNRCGLSKKSCSCVAPTVRSIGVQVEMDKDMTTRVLDLTMQGVTDFLQHPPKCM